MDWFPSKDFEGEIKEGKESHMWMCGKLSFFLKGGLSFLTYVQKEMVKLFYA